MNKLTSDLVSCKWCKKRLIKPVLLPCGETICEKHTGELRKPSETCMICGNEHKNESFHANKIAEMLLKAEIDKLNFGEKFNKAAKSLEMLGEMYKKFENMKNDPEDFLYSHFPKL